jgi:hypothetical protein
VCGCGCGCECGHLWWVVLNVVPSVKFGNSKQQRQGREGRQMQREVEFPLSDVWEGESEGAGCLPLPTHSVIVVTGDGNHSNRAKEQ